MGWICSGAVDMGHVRPHTHYPTTTRGRLNFSYPYPPTTRDGHGFRTRPFLRVWVLFFETIGFGLDLDSKKLIVSGLGLDP